MTARGKTQRNDRGVVLLNALVIVTALAAVAIRLLVITERDQSRLGAMRAADQAALYLDAGETLVTTVLEEDFRQSPDTDHLDELWAIEDYAVPIDRGVLSGRIYDLQGRFNVNWLTDPDTVDSARAFERLALSLRLDIRLAQAVIDYLRPGGPVNPTPYINRPVPVRAQGGPILAIDELRVVPFMTAQAFATLAPFISALPFDSRLNVNTAPPAVLAAFMPVAGQNGAAALVRSRTKTPYGSAGDFVDRATADLGAAVFASVPAGRFTAASTWFMAVLESDLDGTRRRRMIVVHRSLDSGAVTPKYRMALP